MKLKNMFELKNEYAKEVLFNKYLDFIIYGAGNAGKNVLKVLKANGRQVKYFVDVKAKVNDQIEGIPVITPDKACSQGKNACLIIGIFNGETNINEVINNIKKMSFAGVINFCEFYHIFPAELGNKFFLGTKDIIRKNKAIIIETQNLFEDEKSEKIYEQTILFRYTGDIKYCPKPEEGETQYFPSDIKGWNYPSKFVDCGAFTGDTLLSLHKKAGKIKSVMAFEPDPTNFEKLKNLSAKAHIADETILIPCGVYSENKQLNFSASNNGSSAINADGGFSIQTIALNDTIMGYKPDIIKMDIEGAEIEALKGSIKIIKKERPNLAICIYHTPEHLWQIPNLINNWNLGYKLYLRVFGYQSFELVLFAVKE